MFDQSVVRRSGQWWKLTTGFAGVVVAGGVLIYGISRGHFAADAGCERMAALATGPEGVSDLRRWEP